MFFRAQGFNNARAMIFDETLDALAGFWADGLSQELLRTDVTRFFIKKRPSPQNPTRTTLESRLSCSGSTTMRFMVAMTL
jgi:hypothetical protein